MSMLSSHWYIDHPDILSTTMDVYNKDLVNQFGKNSESDEIHQNTEIIQVGDDHDTEDEVQLETSKYNLEHRGDCQPEKPNHARKHCLPSSSAGGDSGASFTKLTCVSNASFGNFLL
jgi:hypothetical protein